MQKVEVLKTRNPAVQRSQRPSLACPRGMKILSECYRHLKIWRKGPLQMIDLVFPGLKCLPVDDRSLCNG